MTSYKPPMKLPEPVLDGEAIYLGDNGRCFCGEHAGMTARYTGRDLSGQRVLRLEPRAGAVETFACEHYGCTRRVFA